MKIAIQNGKVILAEVDALNFEQLKRVGLLRWNKTARCFTGALSLDLLNSLQRIFRLPGYIEEERQRLLAVCRAVEAERAKEEPAPLYDYPVKAHLFRHQIRGANMAMLTFGWIENKEGGPELAKG